MSQRDKLREKLRARPVEMRYRDVRRLLILEGWEQRNQVGSHVSFKKVGHRSLTISTTDGLVPQYQLDQILDALGLDD